MSGPGEIDTGYTHFLNYFNIPTDKVENLTGDERKKLVNLAQDFFEEANNSGANQKQLKENYKQKFTKFLSTAKTKDDSIPAIFGRVFKYAFSGGLNQTDTKMELAIIGLEIRDNLTKKQ